MIKKHTGWDPVSQRRIDSWYRYNRIMSKSVLIPIDFTKTQNFLSMVVWLRTNVRNISPLKTKPYSTRWWVYSTPDSGGRYAGVGFRNKDDALQFKLMGFHTEPPES